MATVRERTKEAHNWAARCILDSHIDPIKKWVKMQLNKMEVVKRYTSEFYQPE